MLSHPFYSNMSVLFSGCLISGIPHFLFPYSYQFGILLVYAESVMLPSLVQIPDHRGGTGCYGFPAFQ